MPDFSQYNKQVSIPGSTVTNALKNFSQRQTTTGQMVLQHGMNLESASHQNALAKDLATHTGMIQSGLSAQEHAQTSTLSAQEHLQRKKENAATNRHEIKKIVLGHNNDLEKTAVTHNNSLATLRTGSTVKIAEEKAAHKNAADLIDRLHTSAAPGTEVSFKHGGISANFTLKTPPSPATNPTPTVAPAQTTHFVGMPSNRASASEAPKGPQPTVKRGPDGKMVSLKNTSASVKKAPAKKSAPAKGQPTVTRDPKTGRMVGIKKK